ncbi:NADPH-dependent FMN reductase [Desertivirga xinjiangensis]|uniref:NADPH-dependent FMN reductase n=1 Tax=Desertivirga xinjiangensis TaxID=539206 RepID=UPI00210C223B|nr:NAD(P)H-dependent oxidoreductase [Pedobacter xinjiangensis]
MTDTNIKFTGISGSLRKGSFNTMLLKAAQDLLPQAVSMTIASIAELPLYNSDLDLPIANERPESVRIFRELLHDADAILISSPEYNYSIPGGLKNAIDWASRGSDSPLLNKPVAIVGATPGLLGTVRMQLAFLPVFQFLNMQPVYKPEVLISQANTKFDEDGTLIDKKAEELLVQKLEALKEMVLIKK